MNEIAKKSVSERLLTAIKKEKLLTKEAGAIIGVLPAYITMVKNPKYWSNCPTKAWDAILAWVNSGYSLHDWKEKKPVSKIEKEIKKPTTPKESEITQPEFKETPVGEEISKAINTRPPLGVKPRQLVEEERLHEIQAAIGRYMEGGREIPMEWVNEHNEIINRWKFSNLIEQMR